VAKYSSARDSAKGNEKKKKYACRNLAGADSKARDLLYMDFPVKKPIAFER
jgi:hypothetical protein